MSLAYIQLRNYRSFAGREVRLELGHQFLGIVGVNNSGKSSILRSVYELRNIFLQLSSLTPVDWATNMVNSPNQLPLLLQVGERIFPIHDSSLEPRITLGFDDARADELKSITFILKRQGGPGWDLELSSGRRVTQVQNAQTIPRSNEIYLRAYDQDNQQFEVNWSIIQKAAEVLSGAMYIGPFRNTINSGGAPYFDLAIGKDFISQYDQYKTGEDAESNEAIVKMAQELAAIFGFRSLEVNATPSKDSLTYLIDSKSLRGSELGAGISQFVIVVANVLVKKPTLLFIDEPELNLHASLQQRFLTLLASYVKHGVIFSTHSLGLARAMADKILVSQRVGEAISTLSEYNSVPSLASTLGEMGYGGLNDSAYKAILLVEGVTDVRTYQQMLVKYGVRNEVVLVPLGGDSMASGGRDQELAELCRLSDSVYALADSERTSESASPSEQRQAFKVSCEAQGIDCHLLERRAVENYLDLDIARQLNRVGQDVPSFDVYSKPQSEWSWNKELNWRIAQEMDRADLDATDLGSFLQTIASNVETERE